MIVIVASTSIATVSALKTLVSPNSQAYGYFGDSVALSSGLVAVGAGETVSGKSDAGRVYVFVTKTGTLTQTLVSPNSQADGDFGHSVALSSGVVVVGAPGETVSGSIQAGRAYVFNANTGALTETLVSPNSQAYGGFGVSVALSSGLVVVGAPLETVSGNSYGRAYVFNTKTGALTQTLLSPNPQTGGLFGLSVALSGGVVAVGAPDTPVSGNSGAGCAYVFNANTGALTQTLLSPNSQAYGEFGLSVALSSGLVAVGAFETVSGSVWAGRAYVFNAKTGALTETLVSPNSQADGYFGYSVALSSDVVVVGAYGETVSGSVWAGRAYVFNAKTGALTRTLVGPKREPSEFFGYSVALSGGVVAVGAPYSVVSGNSVAGRAYVF